MGPQLCTCKKGGGHVLHDIYLHVHVCVLRQCMCCCCFMLCRLLSGRASLPPVGEMTAWVQQQEALLSAAGLTPQHR